MISCLYNRSLPVLDHILCYDNSIGNSYESGFNEPNRGHSTVQITGNQSFWDFMDQTKKSNCAMKSVSQIILRLYGPDHSHHTSSFASRLANKISRINFFHSKLKLSSSFVYFPNRHNGVGFNVVRSHVLLTELLGAKEHRFELISWKRHAYPFEFLPSR